MSEEFKNACDTFIRQFNETYTDIYKRYEKSIEYAFNAIGNLDHVSELSISNTTAILISHENQMGLLKRVVRQRCKYISFKILRNYQTIFFFADYYSHSFVQIKLYHEMVVVHPPAISLIHTHIWILRMSQPSVLVSQQ